MYLFIHACMNTSSYLRIRSDTSHPAQLPTPKQHLQDSIVQIPVMIQFQLDQWPSETLKRKNIHHIHKSYTYTLRIIAWHDIALHTHTYIYIHTTYIRYIIHVYDRIWSNVERILWGQVSISFCTCYKHWTSLNSELQIKPWPW
jgi:hypothetical protein